MLKVIVLTSKGKKYSFNAAAIEVGAPEGAEYRNGLKTQFVLHCFKGARQQNAARTHPVSRQHMHNVVQQLDLIAETFPEIVRKTAGTVSGTRYVFGKGFSSDERVLAVGNPPRIWHERKPIVAHPTMRTYGL